MSHCFSDIRPLEIYNNFNIPLSTITFTVNIHADNHFYKNNYLFQILYSMKIQFFLLKYMLRFIFIRNLIYRKKLLIEKTKFLFPADYVKIIEFILYQHDLKRS